MDHSLSWLERGLAGFLLAEGPENEDVFYGPEGAAGMRGH
jgi:hypothetical protein